MDRLLSKPVFWISMLIAQVCAFFLFKDLADISQWLIQGERSVTMAVWYNRYLLTGIAMLLFGLSLYIWWKKRSVAKGGLVVTLGLLFVFEIYMGMINPHIMMRARQHDGVFLSVQEAAKYYKPKESVIVYDVDGKARAHSDKQLLRPHVAGGGELGGDAVVMTYCGLTNLGIAYVPDIDGQQLDLAPFTQLENNLVLFDKNSGEPIQQLWGATERDVLAGNARRMEEVATFRMPFDKFAEAYPNGEVYVNDYLVSDMRPTFWENPFLAIYDPIMELIFGTAIAAQFHFEGPVFPTIDYRDDRLDTKTPVWGITVNQDHVAYTEEFVREQGNLVNSVIGDRPVVIAYDEDYQSLGAFYNDSGKPVTRIDFWGQSDQGQLERVETMKSGAFWIVWANFFRDTDLNRV